MAAASADRRLHGGRPRGPSLFFPDWPHAVFYLSHFRYDFLFHDQVPPALGTGTAPGHAAVPTSGDQLDRYSQLDLRISFSLGSQSLLCRRAAAPRCHGNFCRWQTMDVAPAASRRTARDQPTAHPRGCSCTADNALGRRHSRFLRARFPHEDGRASRALHLGMVSSDQTGQLSPFLRAILRHATFGNDRDNRSDDPHRLRAVAARQRLHEIHGRERPGALHAPRLRHVPSCRRVRRRTGAAGPIWQAGNASRWPKSSHGRSLHSTSDPRSRFSSSAKLSARHAHVSRASQRRADSAIDRLHQIARFGRKDAGTMSTAIAEVPVESRMHYLNASYGIKSWLFTTDHKRIALLYLGSITLLFFIGGAAAVLMRRDLIEPAGALVQPETYNKLFTMHGVIMVFFFLVPSIPATLGNFLVPMMIGARDLAFPRLHLLSWYVYITDGPITLYAFIS